VIPMGPSPPFIPCKVCGCLTTRSPCFDCQAKRDRLAAARAETEGAVPPAYEGARMTAPWLRELVGSERMARAEASLGAEKVLLVGPSAAGKTSLAVAMARAWVELNARPALFVLATELATCRQRTRFGVEPPDYAAARAAPLLLLDELGPDDFRAPSSPVTDVVFHRAAHRLPTWITTWTTHEERVARYGDGFARRVIEGARIIEWKD
jgi:hypothetical protein